MPYTKNYVEVILKPLGAPANQRDSKSIIIVQVPRSQIDAHRAGHQAPEAVTDELIAQALGERRAPTSRDPSRNQMGRVLLRDPDSCVSNL